MPDGVDPACNRMQPAHGDAMLDSTLTQPKVDKLSASHNPMLLLREPGYLPVDPPSSSRPTHIGG